MMHGQTKIKLKKHCTGGALQRVLKKQRWICSFPPHEDV